MWRLFSVKKDKSSSVKSWKLCNLLEDSENGHSEEGWRRRLRAGDRHSLSFCIQFGGGAAAAPIYESQEMCSNLRN